MATVGPNADKGVYRRLLDAARSATGFSYSPYSKFPVGAAVLTDSGTIFSACNVENASYGLTICAERAAIFKAVSEGKLRIRAIAVTCGAGAQSPPCGACRQVIWEFADSDAEIVLEGQSGEPRVLKITELLPEAFGPDNLLDQR